MNLSLEKEPQVLHVLDESVLQVPLSDSLLFLHPGFTKHKTAKTEAITEGMYDSLFEAFERTWSANQCVNVLKEFDYENDVVVEMGCAYMSLYETFKALHCYPKYIGIDIRSDYLSKAKARARKDVVGICADLTKPLPIKDSSVACVILSEVIEHISHQDNITIFKEAYRILKPGGKILVSSPVNTQNREFHCLKKEANLGHIFFWEAEQFEKDMLSIGFSAVDKRWGLSSSSKIRASEIHKQLHPEVVKFINDISEMYGSRVGRAVTLSAPHIENGGCRFTVTK